MDWDDFAEELRTTWASLDAVTRAEKIEAWVKAGNSNRELAKRLRLSEGCLRKIRRLLNASAEDREKLKSGGSQRSALAALPRRTPETDEVVATVLAWMEREGIVECYRSRVIQDVEWRIGSLDTPEKIESAKSKVEAVDLNKRPSYVQPDELGMINGWILWLARYLVKFDGWRDIIAELKQQMVETQ